VVNEKRNNMTEKLFSDCIIIRQIDHYNIEEQDYVGGKIFRNIYMEIHDDNVVLLNKEDKVQGIFSMNKFFIEHFYE
jgi:hypothetical protein